MRRWIAYFCLLAALSSSLATAQVSTLRFPEKVVAGTGFSVPTSGTGDATLYIYGPGGVLRRKVNAGEPLVFSPDELHDAGRYVAVLKGGTSPESSQFDVVPSPQASSLSFLAKPSRLAVNLPNAISGVAYVFDVFGNLILEPRKVTFDLSDAADNKQSRTTMTQNGVAWVRTNSAPKAGRAHLLATADNVHEQRVIQLVAGDPCAIRMTAHPAPGQRVALETELVRDCTGNAVPDGTTVSFTETYAGHQEATVDVPLKRGIARTELPVREGAVISVASGVVAGNEIRWGGGR